MKTKGQWTASVIVITKNQKRFLEMSVPAIQCQQLDSAFEIIAVDSGSTDGAVEYLKEQ